MDLALSNALHGRVRAFVDAYASGRAVPEPFDAVACDLARYQAAHSDGFARLCRARGVDPAALADAQAIPAVPTEAFKLARVATFPPAETKFAFATSGTTVGSRGRHEMRDVGTYDAGALAFGRRWLARDLDGSAVVVVLGPSPEEAPDSSLVHMCAAFAKAFGESVPADKTFFVQGDVLDLSGLDERIAVAIARDVPVLLLATSFALVHLLDAVGDGTFALPRRSRVMQTGGFKGKSREVEPAQLRGEIARVFALQERAIVSEYGMTELSSQFYEQTLFEDEVAHGIYAEPPWARVIPVDPETLEPVPERAIGIAKIVDLANVDSAVAVLTQDRVRRTNDGFELLGRLPGAPPRGCSIAIDELLGTNT